MQYGFFGIGAEVKVYWWDFSEAKTRSLVGSIWERSNVGISLLVPPEEKKLVSGEEKKEERYTLSASAIIAIELVGTPQIQSGTKADVKLVHPINGTLFLQSVLITARADSSITVKYNNENYEIPWSSIEWVREIA